MLPFCLAAAFLLAGCNGPGGDALGAEGVTPRFASAYEQSLWAAADAEHCGEQRFGREVARQQLRFRRLKARATASGVAEAMQTIEAKWNDLRSRMERDCPRDTVHWRDFRDALDKLEAAISGL